MGIGIFRSSFARVDSPAGPAPGDPIPTNFKILRLHHNGDFVAAEILYPDAKNYDGRKIAVYRCALLELAGAKVLDPHFNEKPGPLVPIARFEPTEAGWNMALKLMEMLK